MVLETGRGGGAAPRTGISSIWRTIVSSVVWASTAGSTGWTFTWPGRVSITLSPALRSNVANEKSSRLNSRFAWNSSYNHSRRSWVLPRPNRRNSALRTYQTPPSRAQPKSPAHPDRPVGGLS